MTVTIAIVAGFVWLSGMFRWLDLLGAFCRRGGCNVDKTIRVRVRETGQVFDIGQCNRCKRIKQARVPLKPSDCI